MCNVWCVCLIHHPPYLKPFGHKQGGDAGEGQAKCWGPGQTRCRVAEVGRTARLCHFVEGGIGAGDRNRLITGLVAF